VLVVAAMGCLRLQDLCVAVSVLLHYFFLAAFCLMLAEAVQLLLSTVFVFHVQTTAQTVGLIVAAWSKSWRFGVVVSVVGLINEVNQHRARLVHDG